MVPGEQIAGKVLFGCFEVNLTTGEVFRNGWRLRLSGQPVQVLVILLQRAGQLVTREELRAMLWPGETFVDFDHGLNNCINRIRDALGDTAASPEWIETLPKRGYRFIAALHFADQTPGNTQESGAPASPLVEQSAVEEPLPLTAVLRPAVLLTPQKLWIASISLLAIAAIAVTIWTFRGWNSRRDGGIRNIQAVAVLPLTNLSGDSSQEYLTDGITDELITQLARSTTVSVISRTSIMRYKNRQTPLSLIGRELSVDAVVESSLQRTRDHFKISANLIAVKTDTHLWAQDYEADMSDLPRYASRIALDIAASLRQPAPVRPGNAPGPVVSSEAFDLYLKGQFLWNHSQTEAALRHFQRAVALQPDYAAAYAGIAKSYCRLEVEQVLPPSEAFPPASAAVERALDLDSHNGDAHAARSFICAQRDWNWNRAEEELRIAIAEDPSNSMGHRWYRYILHQKGRNEEALEQARLAVKADPVSVLLITQYAIELARNKHYGEAIANYLEAAEFAPNEDDIRYGLANAYEKTGKFDRAADELEKAYTFSGEADIADQFRRAYLQSGYEEAAYAAHRAHLWRRLALLKKKSARGEYVSPTAFVDAYSGLRDKANTLRWLESAHATDSHVMVELRDERFDFVRQEPRFKKIWDNVPFSH
jgi:TolB-like protein/DNA-binding winged helix-turn-helix (wHTH) protein/tetratricopeptide (TPR) repeat protein